MFVAMDSKIRSLLSPSALMAICYMALACAPAVLGESTGTANLTLTIGPECSVQVASLVQVGGPDSLTQTLTFTYLLRTSVSRGRGDIRLRLVDTGLGDTPIAYQTQITGPGTAVSGSATIADGAGSGIVIAIFGPQASTTRVGATGAVQITTAGPALQPSLWISCQ